MARNYFKYIALFLTVLITVGSLASTKDTVEVKVLFFDKIVHIGAYFLLSLSWLLAFIEKSKHLKYALAIAFLVVVYGIIIEALQDAITLAREADMYDVLANFIGVLTAFLVFNKVLQKKTMK